MKALLDFWQQNCEIIRRMENRIISKNDALFNEFKAIEREVWYFIQTFIPETLVRLESDLACL